jgi:aldehyde dehydrogenase (NAD+)
MGVSLDRDYCIIDGARSKVTTGDTLEIINPFTEQIAGEVPMAGQAEVDKAVAAARAAFDHGAWPRLTLDERSAVVLRACDVLESQVDDIAHVVTTEMGSPLAKSRRALVAPALSVARGMVAAAALVPLEVRRTGMAGEAIVQRRPVGVVGAIAPWNGPFAVAMAKIVPAILTGCTVVFKPAPETPADVYWLVEALQQAGLPNGVVNLVPGGRDVGEAIVGHPDVNAISFTGSTSAGRMIGAVCGQQLKRVQLELGGKSAGIVLADADLDAATPAISAGAFGNSGQVCASLSRILVARPLHDEVVERLAARADAFRLGDPLDAQTQFGPLVSEAHRRRVETYIEIGVSEGATLVTGGNRPQEFEHGWFVRPAVFSGVDNNMKIAQEEIFGPVVAVIPFDTEEEAVAIANDSPYGLHGAVFTADQERALAVAEQVDTGTFSVNGFVINPDAPFGGVKNSGVGREFGIEGIEACLEYKTINLGQVTG